ncbi:hypothetical protein FBU59_003145 [Linderina macrospora]|uniref:Uncharacterized protein n=1 Tax=Linderina macrospora TaxID=4868 RepID=A0ACC1J934_9FUNG|nr:hypothetical protein FBU59_003145 [Linderina macrospora]
MGFRLAVGMGYHHLDMKMSDGPDFTSTEDISRRETCRRAFWGGGKPLGINDDDISVLLPLHDQDWQLGISLAPAKSSLEFFRPFSMGAEGSDSTPSNPSSGCSGELLSAKTTVSAASSAGSRLAMPKGEIDGGDARANKSRSLTPLSATTGWDGRASDLSSLGHFVKLMTVVGQIAQHINSAKSGASDGNAPGAAASSAAEKGDRPSTTHTALDTALLRWKEELPPKLSYSEVHDPDTEPEHAVFVASMHAIYHGAVIMLNRENMSLLRDLPGQFDVSTNLATRSLERCRIAAMELVEISRQLCTLPSSMTSALVPWALFQAGTLLIHFMIAGNSPQAQEEARKAILSLDSTLRDELTRYWCVSAKYHLVLSNMVKAWERTRPTTPTIVPVSFAEANAANGQQNGLMATQMAMPLQMQMQLPAQYDSAVSQAQTQAQVQCQAAFATLMKAYPATQQQQQQVSPQHPQHPQQHQQPAPAPAPIQVPQNLGSPHNSRDQSLTPSFMFTAESAQDSYNTIQAFLSQLSPEQAMQLAEGFQTYSLQGASSQLMAAVSNPASTQGMHNAQQLTADPLLAAAPAQPAMMMGPVSAIPPHMAMMSQDRLRNRRGSIPISSTSDLFIAPGGAPMVVSSAASSTMPSGHDTTGISGDLDPMLFNPMTPFLQELSLFNPLQGVGQGMLQQQPQPQPQQPQPQPPST